MIVKSVSGDIGYLFPRKVAIEYLKLRKEIFPHALTMIDSLSLVIVKQDTLIEVMEKQTHSLRQVVYNDSVAIARLNETLTNSERTLQSQKRKIRLWKLGAMGSGILGTILGFMLGSLTS